MSNPLIPAAAKAVLDEAQSLFSKFLGPTAEEAGAMMGDHIRIFRLKKQITLLKKAEQILKEKNLEPKTVNLKVLLPLLENAAIEDNENMSERWASLLASAADLNNKSNLEASFVEILKQLAPSHAFVLDVFYEQVERDKLPPEQWNEHGYVLSYLKDYLEKDVPQFEVAIDNLLRLNLVRFPTAKLGVANGHEVRIPVTSSNLLCPTSLGKAFISACDYGTRLRNRAYSVPGHSIPNVYSTEGGSLQLWDRKAEKKWSTIRGKL